jgi:hypothetical protein
LHAYFDIDSNRKASVRKLLVYMVMLILAGILSISCEKSPTNLAETFSVRTTLNISTLDMNGQSIMVPVTLKILKNSSLNNSEATTEIQIMETDSQGNLPFVYYFFFLPNERAEIIVDVNTENYQSIQYWTAYITANDAPGKQFDLQLDIAGK